MDGQDGRVPNVESSSKLHRSMTVTASVRLGRRLLALLLLPLLLVLVLFLVLVLLTLLLL